MNLVFTRPWKNFYFYFLFRQSGETPRRAWREHGDMRWVGTYSSRPWGSSGRTASRCHVVPCRIRHCCTYGSLCSKRVKRRAHNTFVGWKILYIPRFLTRIVVVGCIVRVLGIGEAREAYDELLSFFFFFPSVLAFVVFACRSSSRPGRKLATIGWRLYIANSSRRLLFFNPGSV